MRRVFVSGRLLNLHIRCVSSRNVLSAMPVPYLVFWASLTSSTPGGVGFTSCKPQCHRMAEAVMFPHYIPINNSRGLKPTGHKWGSSSWGSSEWGNKCFIHEQNTVHSLLATPDIERNPCRINVVSGFLFMRRVWILYIFQLVFVPGLCMQVIA